MKSLEKEIEAYNQRIYQVSHNYTGGGQNANLGSANLDFVKTEFDKIIEKHSEVLDL